MLDKLRHHLWGDLTHEDLKKFGFLTLIFLCLTGSYSIVHPLKEALFARLVGPTYLPYAKIGSVLFLIPLLFGYAKLVDAIRKHQLFYVLGSIYAVSYCIIAYTLTLPAIGLANTQPDKTRLLGWLLYVGVESFGAIAFSLFWSFVVSVTDVASAKRGYPLLIAGSQLSAILSPELVKRATYFGIPLLFIIAGLCCAAILIFVKLFIHNYRVPLHAQDEAKETTGPIEGIRLLVSRPFLLGVFVITTAQEMIGAIFEYQLIVFANVSLETTEHMAEFFGTLIQTTTIVTLIFSLIGTSFLIRTLGLTACLILYPLLMATNIVAVWLHPTVWVLFAGMVSLKGLGYAFNLPIKEMLYIPTSRDIRYKAKSWIDSFGKRISKATGSSINTLFTPANLVFGSSIIGLGIVSVWIMVALRVGRVYEKITREDTTIE